MKTQPLPHRADALSPEDRELLEKRAERLRRRAEDENPQALLAVAEFPVGAETFAIEMRHLQAVMPLRRVIPVPLAPAHLVGIVRFQGEAIPVLSLASAIGSHGWRQDPAVLVILQVDGQTFGIDCEQVPRTAAYPADAIERARAQARTTFTELFVDRRRVHLIHGPALVARLEGRNAP